MNKLGDIRLLMVNRYSDQNPYKIVIIRAITFKTISLDSSCRAPHTSCANTSYPMGILAIN